MAHSVRLLLETGWESTPGRIFVIGVVHIQCSKLCKGQTSMCSTVYGSTLYYKKTTLKSINKSRTSIRLRASFCRDFAMIRTTMLLCSVLDGRENWIWAAHYQKKTCVFFCPAHALNCCRFSKKTHLILVNKKTFRKNKFISEDFPS